ncbi:glutamate carboxypeptidase 2-like isoform X2 [Homarus americanus]|uniref:glutamate carboxypeptidase 2-like isoform X2 n=1 Tax=Homarus americanus TaxID=6706 RepID=UPI001C4904AF|nr:glutamate carboxypeptidase 2-like isoform X2 [Homarus americanus]
MRVSLVITIAGSVTVMLTIVVVTLVVTLSPNTGGDKDYREYLLNSIDPNSINKFLRELTSKPHPAGSVRDRDLAVSIQARWEGFGLENVKLMEYDVLLSSPGVPNKFSTLDSGGNVLFESSNTQPPVDDPPPYGQDEILSFNAFSANGIVISDKVVYANYGSEEDFQLLATYNISVSDSIVVIRYGQIFRGDKVRFAEARGANGVILYSDPADVAPEGPSFTYPNSVYAPPGATQLGSLRLQGDLLTPGYPAIESAFRIPMEKADLPKIPVQPVGYHDASVLLSLIGGDTAPAAWRGGLNLTYMVGPDLLDGSKVKLEVNNSLSRKTVQDVVGVLKGTEEPDRFVLLGNHYDAWGYGGLDPSSATAALTELVKVFTQMYREGWRPRRTLVFCNWAAEEPGIIGSTEFAEQFSVSLKDRAVVYLNVDTLIGGNYSFMAMGVPMLHDIIMDMAQLVANPDKEEVKVGRPTLYDTWLARYPDDSPGGSRPLVLPFGSGSDYRAFMFSLGIPSMDMCFTVAPGEKGLPLYHTAYETYKLNTQLMDQGLLFHQASARMWGLLALEFSTRNFLPFGVVPYVDFISTAWKDFLTTYKKILTNLDVKTVT